MSTIAAPSPLGPVAQTARRWAARSGVRRTAVALGLAVLVGYPLDLLVNGGRLGVTWRAMELGLAGLAAFCLSERWPRRLPKGLARWVVQVLAVGLVMPPIDLVLTLLDHAPGAPPLWSSGEQLGE